MRITKEFLIVLVGLAAFVGAMLVAWWVAGSPAGIFFGLGVGVIALFLGEVIRTAWEGRD